MKRPFTDRLQDRLWTMRVHGLVIDLPLLKDETLLQDSISSKMAWPSACAALAKDRIDSHSFRRLRAVTEVVETLGPCDGRHHARRIRSIGKSHWLNDSRVQSCAAWGSPLKWPGFLLETPNTFAPTSLRYLSHALWLEERGYLTQEAKVVEIGVGYGGLAAMNALVSDARTLLVDLPEVELAAMKALEENNLAQAAYCSTSAIDNCRRFDCFVSNYAFSELSTDLQKRLIEKYIVRSQHGMIISNANVFALEIDGMNNEKLVATLRSHGIDAVISASDDLLSPSDRKCGTALISW